MPEVPDNIDMTSGNLGLTDKEEDQIVALLQTLSDGFTRPYPNSDTFTGACMRGRLRPRVTSFLIPAPPLPPCASAICGVAPVPGPKPISDNRRAQESPTTPEVSRERIIEGPAIELAKEHLTVIRWTTDNPGGSPLHYGVVHYGTDPTNLSQIAKSPIRLNPGHFHTVFRVRMDGLKPETTYYYTLDSTGADRNNDGLKSSIKHFTTP
jgi:hypothetical protein